MLIQMIKVCNESNTCKLLKFQLIPFLKTIIFLYGQDSENVQLFFEILHT